MFPVAVLLIVLGYGLMYTGLANSQNGGKGPTLGEALNLQIPGLPGQQITSARKLVPNAAPADQTPQFTQI